MAMNEASRTQFVTDQLGEIAEDLRRREGYKAVVVFVIKDDLDYQSAACLDGRTAQEEVHLAHLLVEGLRRIAGNLADALQRAYTGPIASVKARGDS